MPADHLFPTTVAGSLPKPRWLAEPEKLWAAWRAEGAELADAKRDAALIWLKEQEDAGIDIVSDGEQFRIHFVHGFLEHTFVKGEPRNITRIEKIGHSTFLLPQK